MDNQIKTIKEDKISGSLLITQHVLKYVSEILSCQIETKSDLEEIFAEIQSGIKTVVKKHSHMVLLRKTGNNFLIYFKRMITSGKDRKEILGQALGRLEHMKTEMTENVKKITHAGSRIIANSNKIMTISNSTLVKEILLTAEAQKRKFEVFCLKSHPADEGIELARTLAERGIKTTIIADAEMGLFMPEMNLVIIGADRIYGEGFVNKSGTLPLCITAKNFNIPVYLAAETTKILHESERSIKQNEENSDEICTIKHENISVRNIYYEKIPLKFIHKIICENSVFETHEFSKWYLEE